MPPGRVKKGPPARTARRVDNEPDDHGLGRSRGGLTTKIHLATEQGQKPLALLITAGHRHAARSSSRSSERIRVPRPGGGRPRTSRTGSSPIKPTAPAATAPICGSAVSRCTIPDKADQVRNRKAKVRAGGRPPTFDQGGLQGAPRGGVRDQPTETAPRGGHEIRQAGRALRSNSAGRSHQRVAPPRLFKHALGREGLAGFQQGE